MNSLRCVDAIDKRIGPHTTAAQAYTSITST
jgi:hypothetical protein